MGSFSIWHWLIVLVIVLLVFGRGKIPDLMGDMAKGIKSFKKGLADEDEVPVDQARSMDQGRTVEHRSDETVATAAKKSATNKS